MNNDSSRWPFSSEAEDIGSGMDAGVVETLLPHNITVEQVLSVSIMRWVTVNADHIVVLILLLALACKFILFEEDEQRFMSAELDLDGQCV